MNKRTTRIDRLPREVEGNHARFGKVLVSFSVLAIAVWICALIIALGFLDTDIEPPPSMTFNGKKVKEGDILLRVDSLTTAPGFSLRMPSLEVEVIRLHPPQLITRRFKETTPKTPPDK